MVPGFKPHELATRYDVERFSEDEWHSYSGERTTKLVAEHLRPKQAVPQLLLNAGAGVYQLGLPGWTEVVVDIFDAPIRGRKHSVRATVEELPFEARTFGAVVCVGEVLGYCNPVKAILEFARVTAPAGFLICDFSSTRSFRHWLKKEYGRAADLVTDQYNGAPEPIWIYNPSYMRSLLISSGFHIRCARGTHTWSALSRRLGISPRLSTSVQRHLEWLRLPSTWADLTTIVAVRAESAKRPQ